MSLINDALRRASQSEKNRPRRAAAPMGMEPAPAAQGSHLSLLLAGIVLVALLMAGWFFWQWWNLRNNPGNANVAANVAPPVKPQAVPLPVAPVAPVAPVNPSVVVPSSPEPKPVALANPASAPVVVAAVTPAAAPVVAAPSGLTSVSNDDQSPWPVDLKLGGIFFSKTKPKVLINGNIYGIGDVIQGVLLEKIEPDKAILKWNGHSRVLMMAGQ